MIELGNLPTQLFTLFVSRCPFPSMIVLEFLPLYPLSSILYPQLSVVCCLLSVVCCLLSVVCCLFKVKTSLFNFS